MQSWRVRILGIESIPAWLGKFEVEQFFRLSPAEISTVRTRRGAESQLGLALHIGFLRMSGQALNSSDLIHWRILAFIGAQLGIKTPMVASLRALYPRQPTLHEHQRLARGLLGFRSLNEPARRQLVAYLRQVRGCANSPDELNAVVRQWLYEHKYLIPAERQLLDLCRSVVIDQEAKLVMAIGKSVQLSQRKRWLAELAKPHESISGISNLDWLKQSPRSRRGQGLSGAFERIFFLHGLDADKIVMPVMPLSLIKAYASKTARLKFTRFARMKPATQTIGIACFMQVTLWRTTDEAIEAWMLRVSEIRRAAMDRAVKLSEQQWQERHFALLAKTKALLDVTGPSTTLRFKIQRLVEEETFASAQSRAGRMRGKLLEMNAHVRGLLRLILRLPIQLSDSATWLQKALPLLRQIYRLSRPALPAGPPLDFLPRLWLQRSGQSEPDLRLLEAATLLQLQRSLRNGSAAVRSSLNFREFEDMLMPPTEWEQRRSSHLQLLDFSRSVRPELDRLGRAVSESMRKLASAVRSDKVIATPDRGLELPGEFAKRPLREPEDSIRESLCARLGGIELPRLMMEIDAQVRFSSTLLRRTPQNTGEVMAVYGALLAHGMGLDRIQAARMIPDAPPSTLRTMMRVLEEEGRLSETNLSVMQFMRRHPVVMQWGEAGLASADMMTVESSRRLWNARVDPRTGNYAIGTYTHVLDQWGIAHDQPVILNRRQAGPAIEGVLMQKLMPIDRLAVDTHGYTDVAMGLSKLLGFDLCPRLAMLRDRKLYVPSTQYVSKPLRDISVRMSMKIVEAQWDELLRLAASIRQGWCSASQVLQRLGSDAQGSHLYQAAQTFGRLVRTQFLCQYFLDAKLRDAMRRVLNRGESVHQLQRTIRPYAIAPKRGRSLEEQRAISGSLTLLSNLVMAWNTSKIQALVDLPEHKRRDIDLYDIARIGPVATSHINFRGVLHFPVQEFAEPVLRSVVPVPVVMGR